jgi:hypothetical protein
MFGAWIDTQIAELLTAERPARQHALDRLFDDALRKRARQDLLRGAFLDPADVVGVVVVDFLLALSPGKGDLGGVDDDDIVAIIDVRGEAWLVLAA